MLQGWILTADNLAKMAGLMTLDASYAFAPRIPQLTYAKLPFHHGDMEPGADLAGHGGHARSADLELPFNRCLVGCDAHQGIEE